MTEHDTEFQALARRIKDLRGAAEPSSWRMDYVPLTALVLCLLIFDTETWPPRLILLALASMAAGLLWFGRYRAERRP